MKRVMVRYRVKPDRIAENEALVRAVFSELARERPGGLRYTTFTDGAGGFVHLATLETADGANPLLAVAAFRAFTAAIAERCVEPPVTMQLVEVGQYPTLAE